MTATVLTIAGSDSGGGAGIQADLKTFSALGTFGCSVITAITAQNTKAVTAVHPIPIDIVSAQIDAVLSDIEVHAIKIGMLGAPDLIATVAEALEAFQGPIVLDPVMVAKSGDALLPDSAVTALTERLIPLATILTPNIPEAARILETEPEASPEALRQQGHALLSLGPTSVLMKGGHGEGPVCTDWLITQDGETPLTAERIATQNTHGTGCSLSSAIAAEMAKGQEVVPAVAAAHAWLHQAIREADMLEIGQGHGPVHHFHGIWP